MSWVECRWVAAWPYLETSPLTRPAFARTTDSLANVLAVSVKPNSIAVSIILALLVIAVALVIGYAAGRIRRKPDSIIPAMSHEARPVATRSPSTEAAPTAGASHTTAAPDPPPEATSTPIGAIAERARIIRSFEAEAATLRRALAAQNPTLTQLGEFADERRGLFAELATARGETARYRQLVIDLENNAPPPFFGIGAPDDLKLIVGVGPVLERMLQQLGVATYRQIARWSERDIDEFDAKLHEFPGRIRRDAWVTQARALHQSKYGDAVPPRERG